jgi:hypothetical protein
MKECMPGSVQEDGELGYCWMHHFKCHSARTCYTWAAGGPITEDKVSEEWQEKNMKNLQEKDDRCTRIAKRKYDVWPSAYASGAVVRCRQGKIWKGLKESGMITEEEEDLVKKITKILRDEGGAAGLEALVKGTKAAEKDIKDTIEDEEDFVIHTDGDIILKDDSLDEKKKKKAGTESSKESSLRDWFGRKGAKGKTGGWVDCNTCRKDKKTGRKTCKSCGRQKGEKRSKYPACRPTPAACGEQGRGKSWGKKSKAKSEGLQMHINEGVGVDKNLFRPGSRAFFALFREARELYNEGQYTPVSQEEKEILENSNLGEVVRINGEIIPLDFPMLNDATISEAEYKGKKVSLGKPTKNTGGGKKYKVYVRNPKTGNVKKITYGDSKGGLKGNWNNAEARKSFAARHNCKDKKDRTKAGYWACRAHKDFKDFGKNVPGRFW